MKKNIRPIDLAKKLRISTSTLRNYEAKGLIPSTDRTETGYRIYTEEHIAYFECILAMSLGFGMDTTTEVLKKIQVNDLESALWMINNDQVKTHHDKTNLEKAIRLFEKSVENDVMLEECKSIHIVSKETELSTSTLRYWEKEGYIYSKRDPNSNYRLFNPFQVFKIYLMKTTQNTVYSNELINIKNIIKRLNERDSHKAKIAINEMKNMLNKRNRDQLRGQHFLYKLCELK